MGVTALPSGFSGLCYRFIVLQKAGFDKTQPMLYVKLRLAALTIPYANLF